MSDFVILSLILFLVVCLILTIAGFVFYSGLLSEIVVRTGSPPVKKMTIAYKLKKGAYRERGSAFTESCSIAPQLCSIALYYDNPNEVSDTQASCSMRRATFVLSSFAHRPYIIWALAQFNYLIVIV